MVACLSQQHTFGATSFVCRTEGLGDKANISEQGDADYLILSAAFDTARADLQICFQVCSQVAVNTVVID